MNQLLLKQRKPDLNNVKLDFRELSIIYMVIALVVIATFVFWRTGSAASSDSIDRDVHDSVVRTLQEETKTQRVEAGVIICSMASAIALLYINGRKDMKATRVVIARLASALDKLPCRPDLCTNPPSTESEVS